PVQAPGQPIPDLVPRYVRLTEHHVPAPGLHQVVAVRATKPHGPDLARQTAADPGPARPHQEPLDPLRRPARPVTADDCPAAGNVEGPRLAVDLDDGGAEQRRRTSQPGRPQIRRP